MNLFFVLIGVSILLFVSPFIFLLFIKKNNRKNVSTKINSLKEFNIGKCQKCHCEKNRLLWFLTEEDARYNAKFELKDGGFEGTMLMSFKLLCLDCFKNFHNSCC